MNLQRNGSFSLILKRKWASGRSLACYYFIRKCKLKDHKRGTRRKSRESRGKMRLHCSKLAPVCTVYQDCKQWARKGENQLVRVQSKESWWRLPVQGLHARSSWGTLGSMQSCGPEMQLEPERAEASPTPGFWHQGTQNAGFTKPNWPWSHLCHEQPMSHRAAFHTMVLDKPGNISSLNGPISLYDLQPEVSLPIPVSPLTPFKTSEPVTSSQHQPPT